MKSTTFCMAALGALSLTACGQAAGSSTSNPTTAAPAAPIAVQRPIASDARDAAGPLNPASAATQARSGAPLVVVDSEAGIQITPSGGGQMITVAFGTPRTQAQATLFAALGQPRRSTNQECPWGPATLWDWDSGQAVVVNDELVGWIRGDRGFGYTCIAD